MIVTFALLTLSILSLWLFPSPVESPFRRPVWAFLYLGAVAAALASGIAQPIALLWIVALAAAAAAYARFEHRRFARLAAALAIVVLCVGLMAHQLPGFANPRVIAGARFTPDALPFRLHLNFDKASAGLLLLVFLHPRIARLSEWRAMFARAAPAAGATLATLLVLSVGCGYVAFAPKLPPETGLFLWANLCLTCVAEEALFRGFVQAQLSRVWSGLRHGAWIALAVAAILFGLAHAAGGPVYVALSTLAGVGYGWSYLRSGGRIEASILTHFALNAVHFLGFTYPALQRAA